MSLYSGESLTVTVSAFDRVTKFPISAPTCTVNFFAPPKNPKINPSDRVADYSFQAVFDAAQNLYVAYIDTDSWIPGIWWYQGVLTLEPYSAWEYQSFTMTA